MTEKPPGESVKTFEPFFPSLAVSITSTFYCHIQVVCNSRGHGNASSDFAEESYKTQSSSENIVGFLQSWCAQHLARKLQWVAQLNTVLTSLSQGKSGSQVFWRTNVVYLLSCEFVSFFKKKMEDLAFLWGRHSNNLAISKTVMSSSKCLQKYTLQIGTNFNFVRVKTSVFHSLTHTGHHLQPTELNSSNYSRSNAKWQQYGMITVQVAIRSCFACCAGASRRALAARLRLMKQSCPTIDRFDKMSKQQTL